MRADGKPTIQMSAATHGFSEDGRVREMAQLGVLPCKAYRVVSVSTRFPQTSGEGKYQNTLPDAVGAPRPPRSLEHRLLRPVFYEWSFGIRCACASCGLFQGLGTRFVWLRRRQ